MQTDFSLDDGTKIYSRLFGGLMNRNLRHFVL